MQIVPRIHKFDNNLVTETLEKCCVEFLTKEDPYIRSMYSHRPRVYVAWEKKNPRVYVV